MTTNHIVPAHKDDQRAIRALAVADEAQIMLAADDLLEWMQDGNWPVSLPIGEVLAQHIDKIQDKVILILRGNDSAWKYCCIRFLLMDLSRSQMPIAVLEEVRRIALTPTADDVAEEASEAAKELLTTLS